MKDSIFRGDFNGIDILAGLAEIEHVVLEADVVGTGTGLLARGGQCSVRNSVASNFGSGFAAVNTTTFGNGLYIENCVAFGNANGVIAQSTSTGVAGIKISNSTVTAGGKGLVNQGSPAVLLSRGNNTVEGNTFNLDGTIGTYSAQ